MISVPERSSADNTQPSNAITKTPSVRLHRCHTVQDGHSFAEDRLYNSLWNHREARNESDDSKLVTIGWDRMAHAAGMTPRNAKQNCLRLIEKLAAEKILPHNSDQAIGTTYRIYSYKAIVRRRREAGMEWVIRNRGGVAFTAAPHKPAGAPVSLESPATKDTVSPEPPSSRDTVPSEATAPVSLEATAPLSSEAPPLSQVPVREEGTTPSSCIPPAADLSPQTPPRPVVDTFLQITGHSDDDAVHRIVSACKKLAPDVTVEEIINRMAHQGVRISEINQRAESGGKISGRIANPVGFLISEVPKCFAPESLAAFREKFRKELEQANCYNQQRRQHHLDQMAQLRQVLNDPDASDYERECARETLDMEQVQIRILADPRSSAGQIQMARAFLCQD